MKKNNYRATNFRIDNLYEKPSVNIHFADLEVSGEEHNWERAENLFETSKRTIEKAILEDNHLRDPNTGKFVIAFPFGFVIYCFGTPGEEGEINSTCVRYKEYDFDNDFSSSQEIEQVIPCPLEDMIKVHETSLWHTSESMENYYQSPRETFVIENKYPEKLK